MKFRALILLVLLGVGVMLVSAQAGPTPAPTLTPAVSVFTAADGFVRAGPSLDFGILGSLTAGQTLVPVARNNAADWVLIRFRGGFGWIRRDLALWSQPIDLLPVLAPDNLTPQPDQLLSPTRELVLPITATPIGNWVQVTDSASGFVRAGPGRTYLRLGQLLTGETVEPVGRDSNTNWVLIRFGEGFGWIRRDLVRWVDDLSLLPILSESALTPTATFTPSATPTATLTPSATATATGTPSHTSTPTLTATHTTSPTPTLTFTSTASSTATLTLTASPTVTSTSSPSATATTTATRTPTQTSVPPSATPVSPTAVAQALVPSASPTLIPTTATPLSSTLTPLPPTLTAVPPTVTPLPPSVTPLPPTLTAVPPTATITPSNSIIASPTVTSVQPTATTTTAPRATATETLSPPEMSSTPTEAAGAVGPLVAVTPAGASSVTPTSALTPAVAPQPPRPRLPVPPEAIIGGAGLLLVLGYIALYWRGLAAAGRYADGFVADSCPACGRGRLSVETRMNRFMGIPRPRHTIRCDNCRSILREAEPSRWRYAVDPLVNPPLFKHYNGRELTEAEIKALADDPSAAVLPDVRPPATPPTFIDDEHPQ